VISGTDRLTSQRKTPPITCVKQCPFYITMFKKKSKPDINFVQEIPQQDSFPFSAEKGLHFRCQKS